MNQKKDKYRQIVFLILIICGTIIIYTSGTFKDDSPNTDYIDNNEIISEKYDAENYFGIFLKMPNSEKGNNALFEAIVLWDKSGSDSLIKLAVDVFEENVKNESIKNKFYGKLGKYYLSTGRKINGGILDNVSSLTNDSLN